MRRAAVIVFALMMSGPALARGAPHTTDAAIGWRDPIGLAIEAFGRQLGRVALASFYGHGERLNAHTASGERFNPLQLTAAHRTLPLGTRIKVAYAGREVVVRINDRGPAKSTGRELDLSWGAARAIGLDRAGVAKVTYVVMN